MKKHLFVFCFETPDQLLTNPMYGWDDEETMAFFVEAESEEAAFHWGRRAAREYVRALFEREGVSARFDWRPEAYGHRVEPDPASVLPAREQERLPAVRIGQYLDALDLQPQSPQGLAADRRPAGGR